MNENLEGKTTAPAACGLTTIIIPITDGNRQGIDDILEAAQDLFGDDLAICQEAFILKTKNTGLVSFAKALARKAEENTVAGSIFNKEKKKKTWSRKAIAPEVMADQL